MFLAAVCAGDEELRDEAEALVSAHDEAGAFMERPAAEQDARALFGEQFDEDEGVRGVGPYVIVRRLGAGGMGDVYLARDERLERQVALKILPAYFAADDMRLRRFQREARAASALNHPNILTIHEVGEASGVRFIATEFVDGQTLRELITERALSLTEVVDVAVQVASALQAAHAAGIVHRDVKPENIMRRADGLVKLLDFGIAKLTEPPTELGDAFGSGVGPPTEAGVVLGTVGYMSPEQARGLAVDERTDVWSLGCVVYEMLARRAPFLGATRADTLVAILERDPPPLERFAPHAPARLRQIVSQALSKDAVVRYQTATDMLVALNTVRQKPDAPLVSLTSVVTARVSRHLLLAALLAVALTLVFIIKITDRRRTHGVGVINSVMMAANTKSYLQMSEAEQFAFVEAQAQRVSDLMGDRPVKLKAEALRAIKQGVDRYAARNGSTSDAPGGESLSEVYARAVPFVPLIAREFAARRVPVVVGLYLPIIESEYKTCYENDIGAKGLFQFLPQTAKQYGVAREEMCDAAKMTPAAAHYIADRMAELGDDAASMTLVLLSYNRGPEWVRATLRQLSSADNYERNFWTLFANRDRLDDVFRRENAGYVPNFFAAAIVGENPQAFGLQTPPLSTLH